MIKGKRILLTGFSGSIGSELTRQLVVHNKVYGIDTNETGVVDLIEELKQDGHWINGRVGDIRDERTLNDVFSDFKPQVIFHAAALKHVSEGEKVPREYINTNIIGTLNVIEHAKKWECFEKFVFISTDKAVQSSSIMGGTKRIGEIIVRNQGTGFVVVRFGNVLGSRGSLIPLWQNAVDRGKTIKVTDKKMTRYMMTIPEAVSLVIEAAEKGKGGEIFCLEMGKKINIYDLAERLVKEAQLDNGIEIIGIRPGEQLTEKLMFDEEAAIAERQGNFYIIR